MWNTFEDEWSFDGLDVIENMTMSGRGEPALLACQGHGFERDFLEEGRDHELVKGMFLKADHGVIRDAILMVASGRRFGYARLEGQLRPVKETLGYWFDSEPALARIAGAIAAGHGPGYADIAAALGMSTSAVEKSLDLFRSVLLARGEINADGELDKAAVFRWCGEHAHYIVSWCRRHASRHRLLAKLPADVFKKRFVIST